MIRVRTDDVLVTSEPMRGKEFQKWRKHHLWLQECPKLFYHTPAILCRDIQQFPQAIEYIQNEQREGRLRCDLHGWEHDPVGKSGKKGYGKLAIKEIEERLEKCMEWFETTLDDVPVRWLTPHGACSPQIIEAANTFGLIVETTDPPVIDQKIAEPLVRKHGIEVIKDKVIMVHFWERGLRLLRIALIAKYGSEREAKKHRPDVF